MLIGSTFARVRVRFSRQPLVVLPTLPLFRFGRTGKVKWKRRRAILKPERGGGGSVIALLPISSVPQSKDFEKARRTALIGRLHAAVFVSFF